MARKEQQGYSGGLTDPKLQKPRSQKRWPGLFHGKTASDIAFCIRCVYAFLMRTTLDIDLDILEAAKEMAQCSKRTAGEVLSELARKALVANVPTSPGAPRKLNGFEIIEAGDRVVTRELVQKLMEESEAS
jgi:hypothetical protein